MYTAQQIKEIFDKVVSLADIVVRFTGTTVDDKFVNFAREIGSYPAVFEFTAIVLNLFMKHEINVQDILKSFKK